MTKQKAQPQEHAILLEKVRQHYLKSNGGLTQKDVAEQIPIDHLYLNRLFSALKRGERLPRMQEGNLKNLRAYVGRI